MTLKTLNAKYMEEKLKKGWTINDFCQDLGINEQEFKNLLQKNFKERAAGAFKKRMEANLKIAQKTSSRKNNKTKETQTTIQSNPIEEKSELQVWQEEEQRIRDFLFEAESKLQEKNSEKRVCKERLQKSQELLKEFLKQLQKEKGKIEKSILRLTEINSEIHSTQSKIADARQELQKAQEKIEELNVLTLCYRKDGQIVCDEMAIPDNLEYEIFIQDIMKEEILEDLTGKEIRIMAQLLAIAEYFQNATQMKIRFQFEEESNISVAIELLEEMSKK